MNPENKLNLLFITCQLVEAMYWENHKLLNSEFKARFQTALSRVKHLNKDIEKLIPEQIATVEEDVESLYRLVEFQVEATRLGREAEFVEYCKAFFV